MLFRRFFPRDKQGQTPASQELAPPSADEVEQARKTLQELAKQGQDDGVHRMAIRASGPQPPEDPDEQRYEKEQGEHAEIAQSALQARDFKRSIYHLGLALASDPGRVEWLALLDQWIAAVGSEALDFVPLNDEQYFTTLLICQELMQKRNTPAHRMEVTPLVGKNYHAKVAIHAYILASQGKVREAVTLLLQLLQVKPEIPYILWLPRWEEQPGFAQALEPEKIVPIAVRVMQQHPGVYVFSESSRAEIDRYLPLLRHAFAALSGELTTEERLMTAFAYASLLRKTGAFEEAVSVARILPVSYQTRVALAMAEEALGNLDAAIAAYRQALTLQPDDVAVRNDIGTILLKQGKLAEALAFYEESARLDPDDPYQLANASVAYIHYLQDPSAEKWLERLKTLAQQQENAGRLLYLLRAPYIGALPVPGEALLNLARNIKARNVAGEIKLRGGKFNTGLSSLEAPSAWLATKLMLEAQGASFTLAVSDTFSPDPRLPLRPVEYQIWRYEDMNPVPAVPLPDPSIATLIAELAQTPYALERWYALAQPLGEHLGPDALMSLLGVMVHPPEMPAGWDEWDWLVAVQIASALTIASLETAWEGSRRQAALLSLIYGPMDWSGAAALIALAVLAHQDMRLCIEFDRICCDLWHLGRGSAEWPHEQAMVFGLIFLNERSDESRQYIDAYFEQKRQEKTED